MTVSGQPKHINGERVTFFQGEGLLGGTRWNASKPYAYLGSFWTEGELERAIKREQKRKGKGKDSPDAMKSTRKWWQ